MSLVTLVLAVAGWGCQSDGAEPRRQPRSALGAPPGAEAQGAPEQTAPEQTPGDGALAGEQEILGHALRPRELAATDARVASLEVAPGFEVSVFGRDLGHARMLAPRDGGPVYLTRPRTGDVVALWDRDGDGVMDAHEVALDGLEGVHGIALRGDEVFLASNTVLWRAPIRADGRLGEAEAVMTDLPDGGQHPNRTLGFGPDGALYISIGSSCNACDETNEEHATILRASDDLRSRAIFARGLRNTIGFGWHPTTDQMWGMDHGSDWRGDDLPPEELNRLREGEDYGWPYAYGARQPDRVTGSPPGDLSLEAYVARTAPATLTYQAHSAPIGLAFYEHDAFGEAYRGDAFVAMRGSWNRRPPTGYKVVRVRFDEEGRPQGFEDFVTGFMLDDGAAHFGRLAGVAVADDGALLFTDDANGVVYRVSRVEP